MVTVPTWEHPAIVRRPEWAPGDDCDFRVDFGPHPTVFAQTNLCGNMTTVGWGDCLPPVVVLWEVSEDGLSVDLSVYVNRFDRDDEVVTVFEANLPRTWYLSPVTLTNGLGRSITVEDCPVPTEEWTPPRPDVMLHGKVFATLGGADASEFTSSQGGGTIFTHDPPASIWARGGGDTICGVFAACAEDLVDSLGRLAIVWNYIPDGELIVISAATVGGVTLGSVEIPYEDNWHNSVEGLVIPVDSDKLHLFLPEKLNGVEPTAATVLVYKGGECGDPYGGDCEPFPCFPLCVASTCGSDPEVNAVLLFLSVDGVNIGEFTWEAGEGGGVGGYLFTDTTVAPGNPPNWAATLTCVAGVPTLTIDPIFGAEWSSPLTMTCVSGTMEDIELEADDGMGTIIPITLTA
jgi:hypothetical protein